MLVISLAWKERMKHCIIFCTVLVFLLANALARLPKVIVDDIEKARRGSVVLYVETRVSGVSQMIFFGEYRKRKALERTTMT
jgi:hypothetical protein